MRRITVLSIAGTAVLATVTSACGVSVNTANGSSTGSYSSSQQLLVNAISSLDQANSLKADFHFDISPGALSQIESSGGLSSSQTAIAEKVLQAHIVVSESANGPLATATPGSEAADISIVTGSDTLLDFRVVDQNLYVRADFATIASWAGQSVSTLQDELGSAPSEVQQWLQAAINGDWLELSQTQLQAINGILQQRSGAMGGGSSLSPAQARQLASEFTAVIKGVYAKDVTVADKGSTAKGEQLVLTADAHNALADFSNGTLPLLEKLEPSMTRISPSEIQQGLTQVPHKKVTADAYVSNGSLSELSIDFLQFAPPDTPGVAGQSFTMVSDFTPNSGTVSAPSGATQIDIAGLLSELGSSAKL